MALNIFSLVGSIMVDSDEANKSIQKTGDNAKSLASKLGSGLKTVGKAAAGIATVAAGAATAAGAAIYSLSNDAAAVGDNVDKMSQKIGISRQAYQELDFICSQSGTSVDNLKAGLKTLTAVMDTTKAGTSKTKTALEELGIAATDSNGNFRDNEEVMWEAFEALSKLENQTEKERLAVELFGKAGSELLPMLNGTTEGIQAMREQAHELGLVMTDEAIDSAVKYTDTMDQLQRSFKAAKTSLGTAVLPIIQFQSTSPRGGRQQKYTNTTMINSLFLCVIHKKHHVFLQRCNKASIFTENFCAKVTAFLCVHGIRVRRLSLLQHPKIV